MLVLVAVLAVGTAQSTNLNTLVSEAQARMRVPECEGKACKADPASRYRLTGYEGDQAPGAKDRAFADDGSYCGVVGDKRCLSSRHPVIRSGQSPLKTLTSNLP